MACSVNFEEQVKAYESFTVNQLSKSKSGLATVLLICAFSYGSADWFVYGFFQHLTFSHSFAYFCFSVFTILLNISIIFVKRFLFF